MAVHKLSALKVDKLNKPGRYGDGGGLWLQVTETKTRKGPVITKSWLFRFMLHGRARQMGLGPLHTVSLAEAREDARQARLLVHRRIDPIEHRRAEREQEDAKTAKRVTFKEAAEKYIAAHRAGWRNAKHLAQWAGTLETYAYPVIGNLSVAAVDTAHVMKIMEPIWGTKTETASRLRGRIESVLDWAKARHYRTGENPARWRGHLDKLLPARRKVARVQHFDAMPYTDIPALVAELRALDHISAKALEFTILTAARAGEVIGARWSEIDTVTKVWVIPAQRMKRDREHRVPLTDRALEILASLPREEGNPHIFVGARRGESIGDSTMLKQLRSMRGHGRTVHGFRSSFRDWAGESTNFAREVAEAALAHMLTDQTEAAYRRGDALEKRRRLMDAWARYCAKPAPAGAVVEMRHAGAG